MESLVISTMLKYGFFLAMLPDINISELVERNPAARTMPQIFINELLIGGYTDLETWLKDHNKE